MLRIDRADALIGINTTQARLMMSQPRAGLQIDTKPAEMSIHTEQQRIIIDQSRCFEEEGLKGIAALADESKELGTRNVMEGIARRAQEGDRMAAISSKRNAIAEIAWENTFDRLDFNIGFIPQSRPVIDSVGGTVDIRVEDGSVDIRAEIRKPIIDVELGDVEIYLRQRPELHIEYLGENIDATV